MSRYIRYKYQKQQINYLNCNDLDKWIDTCQTRLTGFDSICSGSCNCTTYGNDESEVIYSYKKLNPNYSYDCLDGNRYYKLQKQVSYDGGLTYVDLDEYETGDLYESNSPFCSADTILMDWFESDNYCVGTDLYKREVKRVSFDGGNTWSDMGYTDENGVTTYEYRSSKIESNSCNCGVIGCDNYISFRWSGDTTEFTINGSVPNKSVSVTVTKEDCIDNGDGTYTYRSNMRDIGVDEVTSLSYLFRNNFGLIEVYELPKGDITNMNSMFINNSNLKTFDKNILPNTSKVTTMGTMFSSCGMLTSLDLSGIDTSNVTDMYSMFSGCGSLTSLDLSGWNTSKVTNMYTMFNGCSNLKTLNVSGWDVQQVTSYSYMLQNCKNIEQLIIGETDEATYNWWCARLSDAGYSNCEDIIVSEGYCREHTTYEYSDWELIMGEETEYNSYPSRNITVKCKQTTINNDCTETVTETIESLIGYSLSFSPNGWNYTNEDRVVTVTIPEQTVTLTNGQSTLMPALSGTFVQKAAPSDLMIVYGRYGKAGTDSSYGMRYEGGPISKQKYSGYGDYTTYQISEEIDTSLTSWGYFNDKCVCMNCVSSACSKSEYHCYTYGILKLPDSSNLTSFNWLFKGLEISEEYREVTQNAIENLNATNVVDMAFMLNYCSGLTSLDLSGWNVINVKYLGNAFSNTDLKTLYLSGWNTSNVTNMSETFYNCNKLETLNVTGWKVTQVTNYTDMFYGKEPLKQLIIGTVDDYDSQEEYDATYSWWCARLSEKGMNINIINAT